MNVDSIPICFVIHPVSLIDIAIDMGELSLAMRLAELPSSLVAGPIHIELLALAVAESPDPLSCVLCATTVAIGGP